MRHLDDESPERLAKLYEYCVENFRYDPESGLVNRRDRKGNFTDENSGYFNGRCVVTRIQGRLYQLSRIIVLILTKQYPSKYQIRFRNGNPQDLRKSNLYAERIAKRFKEEPAHA